MAYRRRLEGVCFALPGQKSLKQLAGKRDILEIARRLMDSSVELNYIFEQCPDSIYVTDKDGVIQRVSRAFEETTDILRGRIRLCRS